MHHFLKILAVSSWNTQMVEMMDGTDSIYGPQVGNAIFGYVIGVVCATSSCISGTHVSQWLRQRHSLPRHESERFVEANQHEKQGDTIRSHKTRSLVLVLVCVGLVALFGVADGRYGNLMYREYWLALLMSPLGALIRWRLKALNNRPTCGKGTQWFPWVTFTTNVVASTICITTTALKTYIVEPRDISSDWVLPVLAAVITGFAGSLSTTSSLAHELVVLELLFQSYYYGFATIICSMLVSILIYVPIARFGWNLKRIVWARYKHHAWKTSQSSLRVSSPVNWSVKSLIHSWQSRSSKVWSIRPPCKLFIDCKIKEATESQVRTTCPYSFTRCAPMNDDPETLKRSFVSFGLTILLYCTTPHRNL